MKQYFHERLSSKRKTFIKELIENGALEWNTVVLLIGRSALPAGSEVQKHNSRLIQQPRAGMMCCLLSVAYSSFIFEPSRFVRAFDLTSQRFHSVDPFLNLLCSFTSSRVQSQESSEHRVLTS